MAVPARAVPGILAALLIASPLRAQTSRFAPLPADAEESYESFEPVRAPLGLTNPVTTLVVELAGDPVAVARAKAATPLSEDDEARLRSALEAQQEPVEESLRKRGAIVLGRYQHAYNGVKVRIAMDKARELASIPGVIAVHPLQTFEPDNTHGVPLIGAPAAWGGSPAFHGENVRIAIVDTGIDYTHADFGGPGTPAAYATAHASEKLDPDPAWFGPNAPRVKGGIDLVGDAYDARDPASIPRPDNNPLDCSGHGTHVAGTAAGSGVLADGTTFNGAYDATTISSRQWLVGPGVAPKADLYAIRVFGCSGSTNVVVDALEWAVAHHMDVINMSLGSPFGSATDPSAVAASNAAKAGIIVVASAGNSGSAPYVTGSPASGSGAISVAASDPTASFPAARLSFAGGNQVLAIDANGAPFADGASASLKVLMKGSKLSLGCSPAEYAGAQGKVVVVQRGNCARVARAIYGQKAGATAVVMLNTTRSFPSFEGPITSNPDTGERYLVTIPFLGVPFTPENEAALIGANGKRVTLTSMSLANPGYLALASFSSGGPRSGDSALKPEITAPGVSIVSAAIGTGNGPTTLSGTSMAAPHTAGAAALVRQAHPDWEKSGYWKAALVNTANPALVAGYAARAAGAGLVQVQAAATTQVIATSEDGPVLNFGYAELGGDLRAHREIWLRNFGGNRATFAVEASYRSGVAHPVELGGTRVTVAGGDDASLDLVLTIPASSAGDSSAFSDVSGVITFTPLAGSNGGVSLRVPYYVVPQAISRVATSLDVRQLLQAGVATATMTNHDGAIAGNADWYAWGLGDERDHADRSHDLRAVGAQSYPAQGMLAFAISTRQRWSNAAQNEFDIFVDVDGDGRWDYDVVAADLGALTAGSFSGETVVAVFTPDGRGSIRFRAIAPMNSSAMTLPVLFRQLCRTGFPCLSASNPRFTYWVRSFGWDGTTDAIDAKATFNAFRPAVSTGMFDTVAPNATAVEAVSLDAGELARSPARGFLIVTQDNPRSGSGSGEDDPTQAQMIELAPRDARARN